MLTPYEDREISALAAGGWSISAIARHLGHDRKTIRARLHGARPARQRRSARTDGFEPFVAYVRERLAKHPGVPAKLLYQELIARGFTLSYPTLTARLRALYVRPPQLHDTAPAATAPQGVAVQEPSRDQALPSGVVVVVRDDPPHLTPGAARTLLRILLKAAERNDGQLSHFTQRGR